MKRIRIASLLLAVPLTFLAACGGDDTTAGSQPTGMFSAVPSASAEASSAPAVSDVELCKSAEATLKTTLTDLVSGMDSNGNVSPAKSKKAFEAAGASLAKSAESGGDSDVATALRQLSEEVSKVAKAPDPFKAADGASFSAAGEKFDAACKKAGYTPKF